MLRADTVQPQEAPITQTLPIAQHANLHFVTPNLAVGGDLHPRPLKAAYQLNELDNFGITHIVDCRIEWNDQELVSKHLPTIAYLHHGMDDAGQQVPFTWFDEALAWIDAAGPDAVVLTHCHMGINRGPSLGFAVLLHWGWDPVDAIAAIRAARPQANVWYADDAVRWLHDRHGTDPYPDLLRLQDWREDNPLDVVRLIRQAREGE